MYTVTKHFRLYEMRSNTKYGVSWWRREYLINVISWLYLYKIIIYHSFYVNGCRWLTKSTNIFDSKVHANASVTYSKCVQVSQQHVLRRKYITDRKKCRWPALWEENTAHVCLKTIIIFGNNEKSTTQNTWNIYKNSAYFKG